MRLLKERPVAGQLDINLGRPPDHTGWGQRKPWLRMGAAAVIGGILSTSAWAYDVKIRFNDMYNQPVSGLSVTAGGQTATLADNYYVISGLAEGSYTLSMSTAGYKPFTGNFEVGSNHPHEVFNARYAIKNVNGYRIEGQVVDGNNQNSPLTDVRVSTDGASATTGNDGKFVLDFSTDSSYALTFAKNGYLSVSGSYGVSNSRPRKYTGNITLMNGYTVTGAVKDIDKNGIVGVSVSISGQTATTGSDGTFTVTGILQHGSQKVTISKNGRTLERNVNISRTKATVSAGIFYLVDSYVIQGQVLTVKNKPAVGLTVVSGDDSATTDGNGMYLLRVPNSGSHTVTLQHSGYKKVSTSVGVSDTKPNVMARGALYAIGINDGYYVYGNIKLADPDVLPGDITIEVPKADGSVITAQPDADGNFVLQGLQDGGSYNATVKVAKKGFATVTKSFKVNDGKVSAALGEFDFTPKVVMSMVEKTTRRDLGSDTGLGVVCGGSKVFTVRIENQGAGPVNNVRLLADPALPAGFRYRNVVASSSIPSLDGTLCSGPFLGMNPGGSSDSVPIFPPGPPLGVWPSACSGIKLDCASLIMLGGRPMVGNSPQNCDPNGLDCEMLVDVTVESCGGGGGSGGTYQPWKLNFQATGIGCEDIKGSTCKQSGELDGVDVISSVPLKTITEVIPQFSMAHQESATQAQIGNNLDYTIIVDNDAVAKAAVTNAELQIKLPETVELVSAVIVPEETRRRPNFGECEEVSKTVTCNLDTLPIGGSSTVNLAVKTVLVGQGRIDFTLDSDQTEPQQDSSSNFSVLPVPPTLPPFPVGDADLMFVIDDTGSMTEELNALIQSVSEFIAVYGQTGPNVGLVTFKDEVTNRIRSKTGGLSATNNMSWLLNGYSDYITGIKQLRANLGSDCPEAALKALNYAKDYVKVGGRMVLVTDASSHPDIDVDTLITALRSKGVRLDVILSGEECVGMCGVDTGEANKDSISAIETYSRIAKETGGLFATPFEVNDNTASSAKHYQKVALNLLLGSIRPAITSVLPNKVPQGVSVDLTVTAANTNFTKNSMVNFGEGIQVNTVNMQSPTDMQINVTVASNAVVNFHDITITTQRGEEADQIEAATGLGVLEVVATSEQPAILSITPNSVARDGNATIEITTTNTNLGTGTVLSFADNANIKIQNVTVNSPTRLTATLDVTSAELGSHPITLKTGGEELATPCSMTASPASGSLIILGESNIPRLNVEPNKGAQGAVRRIDITGTNTNFQAGVSELRFSGDNEVYVLEFNVFNDTQAQALIQIDGESALGYKDVYIYSGDEFASALNGFEITAKCDYSLVGYLTDIQNQPIADVEIDTGEHLAFSNGSGYFQAEGLCEGVYDAKPSKEGYEFDPVPFIVSDNTAVNGVVKLPIEAPSSTLVVQTKPDAWRIYQGETVTYTITTTNHGDITATNVVLAEQLPIGSELVKAEALGDGQCQEKADANSVTCELPDLGTNQEAVVKIAVKAVEANRLVNEVVVTANEYPDSTAKTWTAVNPYLSVRVDDNHDPVIVGGTLFYTLTVELSAYLADKEGAPTTATGISVVSYLPAGVKFESVQSEQANCEFASAGNTVTCQIVDLSIDNPTDISQVTIDMAVAVEDAGLLLLVHEAKVMSNEFPSHTDRERTWVDIGEGFVDMAFLVDQTGSMQGEINSVVKAIMDVIKELDGATAPWLALVTFKDEVKLRAATQDLELFKKALGNLKVEGGGTCPEASVEALVRAIPHIKEGGLIFIATDASPYADTDVVGVTKLLADKNIRFNAVVTGDCTMGESWNPLTGTE